MQSQDLWSLMIIRLEIQLPPVRRLEQLLWVRPIVDTPLFFELLQITRNVLTNRQNGLSLSQVNSLVHGLGGLLSEESRQRSPHAPEAAIRMALSVGLDAFEMRVTDVVTAMRYLQRFRREDDPVRYERALALVRQYAAER